MKKFNKISKILFLLLLALSISRNSVWAELNKTPKPLMQRVGLDGKVEFQEKIENSQTNPDSTININEKTLKQESKINAENKLYSYSNMDMKKISDEIKDNLKDEYAYNLADLQILWTEAFKRSETIKFALSKLSNPDGDKEKKSLVKTILNPLASVAPIIGMGSGSAITGSSTILGSGLLGSLLTDDSGINNQLSRVTDSDLVLLAQDIENKQQKLVNLYYTYVSSAIKLKFTDRMVENRYAFYKSAQNNSKEILTVADIFYRESLDTQYKTRQELLNARSELEQFVGNDAIVQVDKNIKERLANLN